MAEIFDFSSRRRLSLREAKRLARERAVEIPGEIEGEYTPRERQLIRETGETIEKGINTVTEETGGPKLFGVDRSTVRIVPLGEE